MNCKNLKLCGNFIPKSYVDLAQNSINSTENLITNLLSHRCLPETGWDDLTIELFLKNMALMDSNNYIGKIGAGERESRLYSNIVKKRHFYMGHGIGRAGDVNAVQPKAAGSSIIVKLTKSLVKDTLKHLGLKPFHQQQQFLDYQFIKEVLVLPLATGMTITLAFLTLAKLKPKAKYVLWPRIDQKTCLKCIITANLIPVIIENQVDLKFILAVYQMEGEEVRTNIDEVLKQINLLGSENILCIFSTTSCFAVRTCDKIVQLAKIAKEFNIFHVVNNAYGVQSTKIAYEINEATKQGKIDLIVSSTDKNFMVPVGGAFIYSSDKKFMINQLFCKQIGKFNF